MEIIGSDTSSERFLSQWNNHLPYIEAQTSGSTGKPKTIKLLKRDMLHSAMATCRRFGITRDSILVSPLSSDYIAGKMMIVRAIAADCKLFIEKPTNHPLSVDYGRISLLPIVPSQAVWLISDEFCYPHAIDSIIVGGAALPPQIEQRMLQKGLNAYATYGMTETCSHVALRRLGDDTYHAMEGITFTTDKSNRLSIHSATDSYSWNTLTTNDAAELISPTKFKFLGRLDNVINSGGVKIHPEHVESLLSCIIAEPFYVVGQKDTKWGESLQLVIESSSIDIEALKTKIDNKLPRLQHPKSIIIVDKIPTTESGKLIRRPIQRKD